MISGRQAEEPEKKLVEEPVRELVREPVEELVEELVERMDQPARIPRDLDSA